MVACIPIQKQSETQLYRVSTPKTLHQKRWVSLSLYWLWRIKKSYVFLLFSGFLVVSVQPNLPEDTVLSKIDTYGLCSKHTYWKEKLQKSLKKNGASEKMHPARRYLFTLYAKFDLHVHGRYVRGIVV